MWFWWFILICDILIPAVMIVAGRIMQKRSPQKINSLLGYRTPRSMKNVDTWRFAHEHCGRLWWKTGFITLVLSALIHIPFYHSDDDVIGNVSLILIVIQCVILIASIFPTESALKKTFYDDGTRR